MRNFKLSVALLSGLLLALSSIAFAKVEGDTITLGSAISLTGKYSTMDCILKEDMTSLLIA